MLNGNEVEEKKESKQEDDVAKVLQELYNLNQSYGQFREIVGKQYKTRKEINTGKSKEAS